MSAAIDKALALDPRSAWAHALKGSLLSAYLRDYAAGEREYLAAIALDSTTTFGGDYGWVLHSRGLEPIRHWRFFAGRGGTIRLPSPR